MLKPFAPALMCLMALTPGIALAEPLPVRIVSAQPVSGSHEVVLTGTLQAVESYGAAFRDSGRLLAVLLRKGDRVAQGDALARIDPTQAEAAARAAQAALAGAEARLREARQARDRAQGLRQRGAGTQADLDSATGALIAAEAVRDQAAAALAKARSTLDDTVLRAPSAGIVTARSAEPGQVVNAGQAVLTIAADGGAEAVFNAPDGVDLEAFLGRPVRLSLIDQPDIALQAQLTEVSPVVDQATGSVAVKARLTGDLPEGVAFGSPVIGRADMARPEGIALPWTALAAKGGAPAVWIVDPAQMTVALAPVTVAEYGVDTVLVSDGVAPGAQVVADGAHLLFPGRSVIARGVSQ